MKLPAFSVPLLLGLVLGQALSAVPPSPVEAQGVAASPDGAQDVTERVEHGFVESDGVRIHYAAMGEGPLVVMVHGFPDFWYGWRHQMEGLASDYRVVAVDQRGYNRSDQPGEREAYAMARLVDDVVAVIEELGDGPAILIGHDWGGYVSWSVAMTRPEVVDRLVIVNAPHPRGLLRELANNPSQRENSQYARNFQREGSHESLSAQGLSEMYAGNSEVRRRYREAFEASSLEAMMDYYRVNYPRPPYDEIPFAVAPVTMPVLLLHGLEDTALLAAGLNGTWEWVEDDLTLVTIPGAGHWAHNDEPEFVNGVIRSWLERQERGGVAGSRSPG